MIYAFSSVRALLNVGLLVILICVTQRGEAQTTIGSSVTFHSQRIAAPGGLVSSGAGKATQLAWNTYRGARSIRVERRRAGEEHFVEIALLSGEAASFRDKLSNPGEAEYRIQALVGGEWTAYSEVTSVKKSRFKSDSKEISPFIAPNPSEGVLQIKGLQAAADQVFVSDMAGRTLLELPGGKRSGRYRIPAGSIEAGRYYLMVFSALRWYTIPFVYQP